MPKEKSDANSVSDLVKNLHDLYGFTAPTPEEPADEPEEVEAPEELEEVEEPEAEAAPVSEEVDAPSASDDEPKEADAGDEAPAQESAPEEALEEIAPETVEEAPEEPENELTGEAAETVEEAIEEPLGEQEAFSEDSDAETPVSEEEPAPEVSPEASEASAPEEQKETPAVAKTIAEIFAEREEAERREAEAAWFADGGPSYKSFDDPTEPNETPEAFPETLPEEAFDKEARSEELSAHSDEEPEASDDSAPWSDEPPAAEAESASPVEDEDGNGEDEPEEQALAATESEEQEAAGNDLLGQRILPEESAESEELPPLEERAESEPERPVSAQASFGEEPAALGRLIPSEQISFDLAVMHGDPSQTPTKEAPSVESLERSSPEVPTTPEEDQGQRQYKISEGDARMILEFGYEDALQRKLGYRAVRNIKYPGDLLEHMRLDLHPYAFTGKEYDGSSEGRKKVLSLYRKEKPYLVWRMIVTALCTLALLFLDVWAEQVISVSTPAVLLPLCGIALLFTAALFSHRALISGYKSLFYFAPTPHSIPALFLPIALIVDLINLFVPAFPFPAVNFPVSMLLLLLALGDAFRFTTESRSFLRVSAAHTNKIALDPYLRHKKVKREANRVLALIDESPEHPEYRVRSTERVAGFFRRCGNLSGVTKSFSITLSLSFGLALVGAIFAWIFAAETLSTLAAFVTVLLYAAPLSSIFAFFYPPRFISGQLVKKQVALVGEESITELGEKSTLLFPDDLAFEKKDFSSVSQNDKSDVNLAMKLSGILFRKLGGIPSQVAPPIFPAEDDPPVTITRIRDSGVEAMIDSRYHIIAGSRDYLNDYGLLVPPAPVTEHWRSAGTCELFIAIGDTLSPANAKVYDPKKDDVVELCYTIEYARAEAFRALLERLRAAGLEGGVFTYDPSLNEAFLNNLYGIDQPPAVVKPGAFDREQLLSITDSPVVSLGSAEALADSIEAAASIRRARKLGFLIQWIASILGAAFALVFGFRGATSLLGVGTLSAFHIATLLITWAVETAQFKNKQS